MRKLLLSPKWWGLHLFVLAAILVMLRLGLWQWHRAESASGGLQNYAYAFQWPLFAIFAGVLWWKTLKIELRGEADETGQAPRPLSRLNARPFPEPHIRHHEGVRIGISTGPAVIDDDDEEVRTYNAYLARLNARAAGSVPRSSH
ncbi:MAG TPA: transcriptional regulator [Mycobacteriales bacterium]|nr:transcriptional regulator [Mycobacteriales bacterium]